MKRAGLLILGNSVAAGAIFYACARRWAERRIALRATPGLMVGPDYFVLDYFATIAPYLAAMLGSVFCACLALLILIWRQNKLRRAPRQPPPDP